MNSELFHPSVLKTDCGDFISDVKLATIELFTEDCIDSIIQKEENHVK